MKKKAIICSLLVGSVLLFSGCSVTASSDGKTITIMDNTDNVSLNNMVVENIQHIKEPIFAIDWLSENQLLSMNNRGDLNKLDIQTKQTEAILEQQQFYNGTDQPSQILSPDKKHVFYKLNSGGQGLNYIMDVDSKQRFEIKIDEILDITQASWIDNQQVIFTANSLDDDNSKTYIADLTGNTTEIEIPNHNAMYPVKVEDKVFFIDGNYEDGSLYAYDINSKETKMLFKAGINSPTLPNLNNFKISPDQKHVVVTLGQGDSEDSEEIKPSIIVMDIDGNNQVTVAKMNLEGNVGGTGWSPDGSKLAYISMENNHSQPQVHVFDMKTSKTTLISVNITSDLEHPIVWSPSGDKLLINSTDQKTGKPTGVDIITFKSE